MLLALLGCVYLDHIAVAGTTYWRITVDRVTVVANGSEQRCNRLATQFVSFERILRVLANWNPDYELPPIAVYSLSEQDARRVFLSETDRQRQRANNILIYSKFLPGVDYNVAAIVDTGGTADPLESVLLLYAEGMLTTGPTQRHPPWFQLVSRIS
jgi:hypothetical protein